MVSKDEFIKKLAQRKMRTATLHEYRIAFHEAQQQRLVDLNGSLLELLGNIPKRHFFVLFTEQTFEVKISVERVLSPNPDFFMKIKPNYRMRNELDPPGYSFIPDPGFHGMTKRCFGPWSGRSCGNPVSFAAHSDQHVLDIISEEMIECMLKVDNK